MRSLFALLFIVNYSLEAIATFNDFPCVNSWLRTMQAKHISFRLYTQEQKAGIIIKNSIIFDNSKKTIFIIHGYTSNGDVPWILKMVELYLKFCNCNIIAVDWRIGAKPLYVTAVINSFFVGNYLAEFIEKNKIPPENVHLIGHSLGAHLAGICGRKYKALYKKQLARITGLDPAKPLFDIKPNSCKIYKDCANYVDIIHTDNGLLGLAEPLGHHDFYPNCKKLFQPSCIPNFDFSIINTMISCNHFFAIKLYTASLQIEAESNGKYTAFIGYKCNRCTDYEENKCFTNAIAKMGYHASKTSPEGKYYLTTNNKEPYHIEHTYM